MQPTSKPVNYCCECRYYQDHEYMGGVCYHSDVVTLNPFNRNVVPETVRKVRHEYGWDECSLYAPEPPSLWQKLRTWLCI